MSKAALATGGNQLLAILRGKDRLRFLAECESVTLQLAAVVIEPEEPIQHVYFPTESFISLIKPLHESQSLAVGMIGDEGMLGASLMLGVQVSPLHALVQGEGVALRMRAASFLSEVKRSSALEQCLKRYLYVTMVQLTQSAACLRYHVVEARLARWLLMTQDRAHSDAFHVTHVSLAYLLGVRRVGITRAANALQKRRLIAYNRGNMTILDRSGLEAASCECYLADNRSYAAIMGSAPAPARRD